MLPALSHGVALGPYNYLSTYGLTYRSAAVVHDALQSDQITQMIPWSTVAWTQVHHGHLPLWNPFSALGMPLAFNWQSATFGVPSLVGYLFPLRLAYTVQILTTMVIAGTGAYVLGRVLRMGTLACAFVGVAFELCGPFFAWTGWPIAGAWSWVGWIIAALVTVMRGGRRARNVAALALAVSLACYAGQPDTLVLLGLFSLVFVIAVQTAEWTRRGRDGWTLQPTIDVLLGGAAGLALAAPLLLPGTQLINRSVRSQGANAFNANAALPVRDLVNLFVGFDGLPFALFSAVGSIVVVLAILAIVHDRRHGPVIGLVAVGAVAALLTTAPPVIALMTKLPVLHSIRWTRSLTALVFVVVMLAGFGLDRLVRGIDRRSEQWLLFGLSLAAAAALLVLVFVAPEIGVLPAALQSPFPSDFRSMAFIGQGVEAVIAVAVSLALVLGLDGSRRRRAPAPDRPGVGEVRSGTPDAPDHVDESSSETPRGRFGRLWVAGAVILVCQTAFMVVMSAHVWTSSPAMPAPSPAVAALQRAVGSSLVGLGRGTCFVPPGLGILPNVNALFDVQQMAVYDPVLPRAYFSSWRSATGQSGGARQLSTFCPEVATADTARQFGIGFVLTAHGAPGPVGGSYVETLGHGPATEDLYKIPGAAAATLTPARSSAASLPTTTGGRTVPVSHPTPATWSMTTEAPSAQVLRLHLTDVPGWRATIDGKPLPLMPFSGIMLQAHIPPGRHLVVVRYWPRSFTEGIVLAVASLIALVCAELVSHLRKRRSRGTPVQANASRGA